MDAGITPRFESILSTHVGETPAAQDDDALHDLALDQAFARIGEGAPRAASAFRVPLQAVAEVEYRQAVFQGLEHHALRKLVDAFLNRMTACDRHDNSASEAHYPYEAELWHLNAVAGYVGAVDAFHTALAEGLPGLEGVSDGWDELGRHVAEYRTSPAFTDLESEAVGLRDELSSLRVNARIRGGKVTIAQTDGEPDLGKDVLETFERFRQGEVTDHRTSFREPSMDHVQAQMLERVALVHPEPFARLVRFAHETREYRDRVLARFADEVRFYLAYLEYLAPLREAGLPVCYPEVSESCKEVAVSDGWDLALATRMVDDGKSVVTNDVFLTGAERILVISGPNQGGKTTTARMVGQLHHLAAIGCPIPGREARVFLCDRVLTVFEREENLDTTLEGRLGAEVQRLHEVFERATDHTVFVINEAFTSTALYDARILTRDVLERISDLDALAVCVTFIDELSRLDEKTVSMVATVDPDDPAVRTFRVERRVADGRAYARALAAKQGLTFEQIRDRLGAPTRADVPEEKEAVNS